MKQYIKTLWRIIFSIATALQELRNQQRQILAIEIERYISDNLHKNPRYLGNKRLNRHEEKIFSQFGEDGIISEIFRRIGTATKFCVEFGVGTGLENNTTSLITQGWRAVWFEASADFARKCESELSNEIKSGLLRIEPLMLTVDNVQDAFANANVPEEFDVLSIDIDGNDLWLWKALSQYNPRVVVIEYNSTYPPPIEWVMPYDPFYSSNTTSYHGASLVALENLGIEKGYSLVGCSFSGANAFFVRNDLIEQHFEEPFTAKNHYEPPRFFLQHRWVGHSRSLRP